MKKRMILILTAVVLVAAVLVGGTWAYRTETVEGSSVVNTGNVKVSASPQRVPAVTIVPGVAFPVRYVNIVNDGSVDAFVRVKVESAESSMKDKFTYQGASSLGSDWKVWKNKEGVTYYLYKQRMKKSASTLFAAEAMPSTSITMADIEKITTYMNGGKEKSAEFKVIVEAIQAENLEIDSMGFPIWPDVEIKPYEEKK